MNDQHGDSSGSGDGDALTPGEVFALRALLDDAPPSEDPIAIRLGLVERIDGSRFAHLAIGSAIRDEMPELPDGVRVHFHPDGTVTCTSLSDRLWIVPHDRVSIEGALRAARAAFGDEPRSTAVVLYSAVEREATALTFAQCFRSLEPAAGWSTEEHLPRWAPLGETLNSFFDLTLPHWDAVDDLERSADLDGVGEAILASSTAVRDALVAYSPNLPHRRDAKEFVLRQSAEQIAGWVTETQGGDLPPDELVARLTEIAEAST